MLVSFTLKSIFMKKSFSMAAAMMAAAVLSVSSFISCDDDDEKFESKTFTVELPAQLGTGYEWVWTNSASAAADSVSKSVNHANPDDERVGGPGVEKWSFKTKENGEEVLKFTYMRRWEESTALKDTVITFKK